MSQFETLLKPISASCARPLPYTDAGKCEFVLNIGMFFDGTNNNKNKDTSGVTHTNVARLWQAYRHKPDRGSFSHYVSGVGTPFTEIDEAASPPLAGATGAGGEERIVYGLLQVINSVHAFINNQELRYGKQTLAALCSSAVVPNDGRALSAVHTTLQGLGLSRGLVGDEKWREKFIREEAAKVGQQLQARATRPVVKSIYVDVFGFSRGAAEARVFVTWLHRLMLSGGKLFGADAYVRMLGLFDTVSSVGRPDAFGGSGHGDWALTHDLPIHVDVKRCVHFVAMHELRSNFPCDSIAVGPEAAIPSPEKFFERFYPGSHSDVGGGYAPGEQGKGVSDVWEPRIGGTVCASNDAAKLSQLALHDMHAAALAACDLHEDAPWIDHQSREGQAQELPRLFAIKADRQGTPLVRLAVADYFANCGVAEGLNVREGLRQHGLRYLAWRYQVSQKKNGFEELPSVRRAVSLDRNGLSHYREGQKIFARQVNLLSSKPEWGEKYTDGTEIRTSASRHAPEILRQMKATTVSHKVGDFFDEWVHDSYAGFIGEFSEPGSNWAKQTFGGLAHLMAEAQRYVRWRGLYCGGDKQLNARLDATNEGRRAA